MFSVSRALCTTSLLAATILALPLVSRAADDHPGAVIYRKMCAECHGDKGQGVPDKYDEPLHGSRSVESLAKRIARTMPDDNVGACVGKDSEDVAAYIYDAFYSAKAQARLRPPEFDLARLTIPQYRASVADLIGRFRPGFDKPPGKEHGLRANYSGVIIVPPEPPPAPPAPATTPDGTTPTPPVATATPPPKPKKKDDDDKKKNLPKVKFDRLDPQISVDFGEASPDPAKMDPEEFRVRWDGSVMAEETGTYEFIVKSENGFRLWVNDPKTNLIDAGVSSNNQMREEKKSIYLLGGRAYPISLEFFKFREKKASVQLLWRTPHGVPELIPSEAFSPDRLRETMVVKTAFPADDRSAGYERGTSVSKEWDQATTEAAVDVAEHVADHLEELAGVRNNAADRLPKLKDFAKRFAEAAFRRPLSDEEFQRVVEKQFTAAKTPEVAIKRVVLLSLKSPEFLYPELPREAGPDDYTVAGRLALTLWDSLPDPTLLRAAAEKKLHTRQQIEQQAARMLTDLRTKAKMHGFFHHWLELERAEAIQKDPKAFPGFEGPVLADLRKSLSLFVDQVVWGDKSDYRELLQANYLLLNERLAKVYGKDVHGEAFQRVEFDPKQRAGVVTHPYLLAAFASAKETSPIHRGVFLTRTIVGMTLKPPPQAVAFEDAKFDAHLTMREKITDLTKNVSCMGCHATINPLGFSLENYDAIGRWRTKEKDKPINPVSDFATDEGQTIKLTGARDLVKFAAENPGGHRAFIHQLFQHATKQAVNAYGPDALEDLRQAFTKNSFNVRKLLLDIACIASERGLPEAEPKVAQNPAATAVAQK